MILTLLSFMNLLICLMITFTSKKKKKDFVFNQIYHLNFKFEIDSRNPSREKKETIESTNAIYKKTHKIPSPDKINETLLMLT